MQISFQISIRAIFLKHSSKYFPQVLIFSQWLFTAYRIKSKALGQVFKVLHNTEQNENWILISLQSPYVIMDSKLEMFIISRRYVPDSVLLVHPPSDSWLVLSAFLPSAYSAL